MFLYIYEYLFLLDLYDNNYVITTQETHTLWRLLLEACAYILYIVMLPSGSVKRSVYRTGLDPESGLESLLQSALHFPTPSGYRHPQNFNKKKSHFCQFSFAPPPFFLLFSPLSPFFPYQLLRIFYIILIQFFLWYIFSL